ncbi:MAG: amidohydrolase family protein [Candidatus Competibacterales bacterium]
MTPPEPPVYDLLIHGATAITGDPSQPVIEDAVVAVAGGRLALVAPRDPSQPLPRAKRILQGQDQVLTPGFVNVHTHTILTMVRGVAEDMGFAPAYTKGVPHGHDVTPDEAVALARLGALEALRFGSTTLNDSYVHADFTLPAMGELGGGVIACGRIHDVDFSRVADGVWEYDPNLGRTTLDAAVNLAQRWRGTEGGRLDVQLAAHAPDTCSKAFLAEVRAARDATGMGVNTHLCQSPIEVERVVARDGMTPPQLLEEVGLLDDTLLAAHCIWLTDEDIERGGRAKIHVAHIPKGNATRATMAPTPKLRRAGAKLTLATDNMHADMVEVMRWGLAVARLQEGKVSEAWQPHHVFAMATQQGAEGLGGGDGVGSLTMGKNADMLLWDYRQPHLTPAINPLGNLVHTALGRDIKTVVVDGEIVVEDGRSTRVDQEQILKAASRAAQQLWARA